MATSPIAPNPPIVTVKDAVARLDAIQKEVEAISGKLEKMEQKIQVTLDMSTQEMLYELVEIKEILFKHPETQAALQGL